ncbi:uncharacterized protein [Amphiura filiformis]|uniref:uncharacterized protein n=1 Tax=Amphiura filiformis TaxID=82378 RepID=UPI003B224FBA
MPIEVYALSVTNSDSVCGNEVEMSDNTGFGDAVRRDLLVEAEGVEQFEAYSNFICPRDYAYGSWKEKVYLGLPRNYVAGSQRANVAVSGDMMGPTFQNLDNLLRVPYGCGEQNIAAFAPNIITLNYLNSTDQLSSELETKALRNIKQGYQRQLKYRRQDASYSGFGTRDLVGSTWLTAFTVRTFAQASKYVYVDERDMNVSLNFLRAMQNEETGCFRTQGRVAHKAMLGGANGDVTMTAYIITTMLQAGIAQDDPTIVSGLECIAERVERLNDTYTIAQTAYALALAQDEVTLPVIMEKLEGLAKESDNGAKKYWETSRALPSRYYYGHQQAAAQNIEMTAYVIQAILTQDDSPEAIVRALPAVRWLVQQQNSLGGFSSTQDTIIALNALSEYASRTYDKNTRIVFNMHAQPSSQRNQLVINRSNRLIQQEWQLPDVPGSVKFHARGAGCALAKTEVTYNIMPSESEDGPFFLSYELSSYPGGRASEACSNYLMNICARYTGTDGDKSNMAVFDVKMMTGFTPDKVTLKALQDTEAGPVNFKKFEIQGKSVLFYFDEITRDQTCFVFGFKKEIDVKDPKPGVIRVYDYYEKDEEVSRVYTLPCGEEGTVTTPVDENLCEANPDLCPEGTRCVDEFRSYRCEIACPEGYSLNEKGQCLGGTRCVDEFRSYRCEIACPEGYSLNEKGQCLDTDECSEDDELCAGGECINLLGNYRCECPKGYFLTPDKKCEDRDECDEYGMCYGGNCTNTLGSYFCTCRGGFNVSEDRLSCRNIDECATATEDLCPPGKVCRDTLGTYNCACPYGYREMGSGCRDINECIEWQACPVNGTTCVNEQGSYRCLSADYECKEQKDGECPVIDDDNLCSKNCSDDCDCEGDSKCCRTACGGRVCSPTAPNPCTNGSLCGDGVCKLLLGFGLASNFECICNRGFQPNREGDQCEVIRTCPADESVVALGQGDGTICRSDCFVNEDCDGDQLCCSSGCSHLCLAGEIKSKPGVCPAVSGDGGSFGLCANVCEHDFQCAGYNEKCCPTDCGGTSCMAAEPFPNEMCPTLDGFTCKEDKCYFPLADTYSWSDANSTCAVWCANAHLAVMNDESEDAFVRQRLPGKDLWLGCTDQEQEGVWTCSGNSDVTFSTETGFHGQVGYWPWNLYYTEEEPNGGTKENCLWSQNGLMRDESCDEEQSAVCEVTIAPKAGQCPVVDRTVDALSDCPSTCKQDLSCSGTQKCCFNGCGFSCTEPVCPGNCPPIFAPVCGTDGKAYPSSCTLVVLACLLKLDVKEAYSGFCTQVTPSPMAPSTTPECPTACIELYAPVCGTNGKTYSNECYLDLDRCQSVECPSVCTLEYAPVCGSDGNTYVNDCQLKTKACGERSGLAKAYEGQCRSECVLPCPSTTNIVCGTNRETYKNLCLLQKENCLDRSVRLAYYGACRRVQLTKCQQQRADLTARPPLPGQYIPGCNSAGEYEPLQCHSSTGQCWCVNERGVEITGTRVRPTANDKPNCQG